VVKVVVNKPMKAEVQVHGGQCYRNTIGIIHIVSVKDLRQF